MERDRIQRVINVFLITYYLTETALTKVVSDIIMAADAGTHLSEYHI